MGELWRNFKEVAAESWDDWRMTLMIYLIVCGGAANLVALFFALKWLTEHVRVV